MGKLELRIEKNFKQCFFGGALQVQKSNHDHDSCVQLNKNQVLLKFRVRSFIQRIGARNVQQMAKNKTFLKFTQKCS